MRNYIQSEKERKGKNADNMENIRKDNIAARMSNVSYGMYKAGLSCEGDVSGEGYQVKTTQFLRPGKIAKEVKTVAFICKRKSA